MLLAMTGYVMAWILLIFQIQMNSRFPTRRWMTLLDLYQCQHLSDFVTRIFWLSDVKEALGYIPKSFDIVYDEILGLVTLVQEKRFREACDAYKTKRDSDRMSSQAASVRAKASTMSAPRMPTR